MTKNLNNKIRVYYLHNNPCGLDTASLQKLWPFLDGDIKSRLVQDWEDPQYVFATTWQYVNRDSFNALKKLYLKDKQRIYIFIGDEALNPDLNIFDYALTFNCDLKDNDRICRLPPGYFFKLPVFNNFTYKDALNKVKNNNLKFCNFIYSNPDAHPMRDKLFYKLSEYKRVDSHGPHLNNTGTKRSREDRDYMAVGINIKSNYKFSIAAENAILNGYTSEKLMTSLKAHTVPIYFGNPKAAELYNPEAFINFNELDFNFDTLMARVKEIDENDELWAKMVSAPWHTEQQLAKLNQQVLNYENFIKNIFDLSVPLSKKKRVPMGYWADNYLRCYFTRKFIFKTKFTERIKTPVRKFLIRHGWQMAVHKILVKLGLRQD
ncbi:MAG: hypothetical protein II948_00095 [Synergistaceae bacterium]|nr:hypothetical protein [Synergistaceae bacterium]MBQ6739734.1 hypothetical protein [Synergistaceae bacterium]MBR0220240.1 hypothetical protein [Synergistaceae bacterium]